MLLPRPTTVSGTFCSVQNRTTLPRTSSLSGSNQTCAGPPIRIVVCFFIGSYQRTSPFPATIFLICKKSSTSFAILLPSAVTSPAPITRKRSPSCQIRPKIVLASAIEFATSTAFLRATHRVANSAKPAPSRGFSPAAYTGSKTTTSAKANASAKP